MVFFRDMVDSKTRFEFYQSLLVLLHSGWTCGYNMWLNQFLFQKCYQYVFVWHFERELDWQQQGLILSGLIHKWWLEPKKMNLNSFVVKIYFFLPQTCICWLKQLSVDREKSSREVNRITCMIILSKVTPILFFGFWWGNY